MDLYLGAAVSLAMLALAAWLLFSPYPDGHGLDDQDEEDL